ncbi:MAG: site-specific integrase [Erysipelotrichaceae bacterium]|nr:site-specific integrase [Erysipelotrichaceae bacterium]
MRKRLDNNEILKTGEGSRVKNGKKIYYYRWNDNGKRKYIYSVDLLELRKKEKKIEKRKNTIINQSTNVTLNDIYDVWVILDADITDRYKYMYNTFVLTTLGKKKISIIETKDIRTFYIKLMDRKHLNINNIKIIHNILFEIFELAVAQCYVKNNVSLNALTEFKKAKGEFRSSEFLTFQEQKLFEEMLKEKRYIRYRGIFLAMLHAGLSLGETIGLQWSNVDFAKNQIDINHILIYHGSCINGKKCHFEIRNLKTDCQNRKVTMSRELFEALKDLTNIKKSDSLNSSITIDGYNDFIFINKSKNVYVRQSLNYILKNIQLDCNIKQIEKSNSEIYNIDVLLPHFSIYALRHTYAIRLIEAGTDIKLVAKKLGNKDVYSTKKLYTELIDDKLQG